MSKYRRIKNAKHALRKMRNRIRRLGDSWYSKEWIVTQRRDAKQEIEEQKKEVI
ncbi:MULTISPECIES: hypothetical protein [Arthrobacter]|uniref:hypothetical protein n=1 Tax=Arthrobacter TaxID=1663 RepID=UPI0014044311|nr:MULTISPECIES: hypothetical protein [Arthrobacter]MBT8161442.1 hypothetical protein [Arthrobacter sp. GN70]